MNKSAHKKTISLYVFPIPVLLLMLAIAGMGSLVMSNQTVTQTGQVLSKGSGDDGEKDEDKNDEDKEDEKDNEDEKKQEEERKESEKKAQEQQKSSGNSKIRTTESNTLRVMKDEDDEIDDEDSKFEKEDEFEAEEELDKDEEVIELATVTNEDGSTTKTYKKIDGNEIKTKILTYDASGKLIDRQEFEEDGSEDDSETKVTSIINNLDGTTTKIYTKTKGDEVEMKSRTYDKDGNLIRKAELNKDGSIKEEEIINEDDDSDESTESETEDENEFEFTFTNGSGNEVDPNLGRILKARIKQELENEDGLTAVNKLVLEIKTESGTVKYKGTASKDEKLFGLFGVEIPVDIEVDPITGQITSVNQSFWTKVLDFFSL